MGYVPANLTREARMKRLTIAALMSALTIASAFAEDCKPVDKNGKMLTGAAKTSHMKSCCRKNAIDKNGHPMKGIVKKQFVDKCMQGA
jgi:hypothetical protein